MNSLRRLALPTEFTGHDRNTVGTSQLDSLDRLVVDSHPAQRPAQLLDMLRRPLRYPQHRNRGLREVLAAMLERPCENIELGKECFISSSLSPAGRDYLSL
ncbi:hypothetical protein [Mycobacterium intracellulare]|uniref:hypothetical protein n=1 Tax=Mycobacterium intracellulare TaxID=1767 RepID=UPI001EEE9DBD|nr:hypothetical protein [Mycobacterium intracellulare]MEE3755234.1 hypothetical protein [Mycobacterium intracellulare]